MSWLRITVEVEYECNKPTAAEVTDLVDETRRKVAVALPGAVDVSVADWSLDR